MWGWLRHFWRFIRNLTGLTASERTEYAAFMIRYTKFLQTNQLVSPESRTVLTTRELEVLNTFWRRTENKPFYWVSGLYAFALPAYGPDGQIVSMPPGVRLG